MPRCLFDGSGIDAFQGLSFDQRIDFLGDVLKGTAPQRRNWGGKVRKATEEGRFEEVDRERHGHPARARRAERRPPAVQVGRDADVRRHRHRLLDRVRQVGVLAAAAAAPGADLRRPGAPRAHRAEDELRRAAARPRGLAPLR